MLTLFQWDLTMRHGAPVGVGIVSGHKKLMEGTNVHTSPVFHVARVANNLQMETASGSVYHLQMKEWSPRTGKAEPLDAGLLGLPADFWAQCAQVREAASETEKADLQPFMRPGTLFMRVVGTHILSAGWAGMDSRIRDAAVRIHLGMFQDSYLITGSHEGFPACDNVDFRLFPMRNRLEPYHISQGIKSLLVCNEGGTDIMLGSPQKNILCPSGAATSISVASWVSE